MKPIHLLLPYLLLLLLTSCATAKRIPHPGMARVRQYEFAHPDVPPAFDGVRIVFATDFHYKSKFGEKQLKGFVKTVNGIAPDLLLLGGDYQEGCQYVAELVNALAQTTPRLGIYAVMGNNDYERCHDELTRQMAANNIRILEHENDTLRIGTDRIILSGVRNPFDLKQNGQSPTTTLRDEEFVILLTHTPDYAEDVPIPHTDLVLAGHTHGGQITLFGLYAPVTASKYGQRFRTGLTKNTAGVPVIVSNGLGTSRKKLRLFAPSEVVLITLKAE